MILPTRFLVAVFAFHLVRGASIAREGDNNEAPNTSAVTDQSSDTTPYSLNTESSVKAGNDEETTTSDDDIQGNDDDDQTNEPSQDDDGTVDDMDLDDLKDEAKGEDNGNMFTKMFHFLMKNDVGIAEKKELFSSMLKHLLKGTNEEQESADKQNGQKDSKTRETESESLNDGDSNVQKEELDRTEPLTEDVATYPDLQSAETTSSNKPTETVYMSSTSSLPTSSKSAISITEFISPQQANDTSSTKLPVNTAFHSSPLTRYPDAASQISQENTSSTTSENMAPMRENTDIEISPSTHSSHSINGNSLVESTQQSTSPTNPNSVPSIEEHTVTLSKVKQTTNLQLSDKVPQKDVIQMKNVLTSPNEIVTESSTSENTTATETPIEVSLRNWDLILNNTLSEIMDSDAPSSKTESIESDFGESASSESDSSESDSSESDSSESVSSESGSSESDSSESESDSSESDSSESDSSESDSSESDSSDQKSIESDSIESDSSESKSSESESSESKSSESDSSELDSIDSDEDNNDEDDDDDDGVFGDDNDYEYEDIDEGYNQDDLATTVASTIKPSDTTSFSPTQAIQNDPKTFILTENGDVKSEAVLVKAEDHHWINIPGTRISIDMNKAENEGSDAEQDVSDVKSKDVDPNADESEVTQETVGDMGSLAVNETQVEQTDDLETTVDDNDKNEDITKSRKIIEGDINKRMRNDMFIFQYDKQATENNDITDNIVKENDNSVRKSENTDVVDQNRNIGDNNEKNAQNDEANENDLEEPQNMEVDKSNEESNKATTVENVEDAKGAAIDSTENDENDSQDNGSNTDETPNENNGSADEGNKIQVEGDSNTSNKFSAKTKDDEEITNDDKGDQMIEEQEEQSTIEENKDDNENDKSGTVKDDSENLTEEEKIHSDGKVGDDEEETNNDNEQDNKEDKDTTEDKKHDDDNDHAENEDNESVNTIEEETIQSNDDGGEENEEENNDEFNGIDDEEDELEMNDNVIENNEVEETLESNNVNDIDKSNAKSNTVSKAIIDDKEVTTDKRDSETDKSNDLEETEVEKENNDVKDKSEKDSTLDDDENVDDNEKGKYETNYGDIEINEEDGENPKNKDQEKDDYSDNDNEEKADIQSNTNVEDTNDEEETIEDPENEVDGDVETIQSNNENSANEEKKIVEDHIIVEADDTNDAEGTKPEINDLKLETNGNEEIIETADEKSNNEPETKEKDKENDDIHVDVVNDNNGIDKNENENIQDDISNPDAVDDDVVNNESKSETSDSIKEDAGRNDVVLTTLEDTVTEDKETTENVVPVVEEETNENKEVDGEANPINRGLDNVDKIEVDNGDASKDTINNHKAPENGNYETKDIVDNAFIDAAELKAENEKENSNAKTDIVNLAVNTEKSAGDFANEMFNGEDVEENIVSQGTANHKESNGKQLNILNVLSGKLKAGEINDDAIFIKNKQGLNDMETQASVEGMGDPATVGDIDEYSADMDYPMEDETYATNFEDYNSFGKGMFIQDSDSTLGNDINSENANTINDTSDQENLGNTDLNKAIAAWSNNESGGADSINDEAAVFYGKDDDGIGEQTGGVDGENEDMMGSLMKIMKGDSNSYIVFLSL